MKLTGSLFSLLSLNQISTSGHKQHWWLNPNWIQLSSLPGSSVPRLLWLHAEGVPGWRRAGFIQRHGSSLSPLGSSHNAQHAVLGSDETTSSEEQQEPRKKLKAPEADGVGRESSFLFCLWPEMWWIPQNCLCLEDVNVKLQLDCVHLEELQLNPPTSSSAAHYTAQYFPVRLTYRRPVGSNFVILCETSLWQAPCVRRECCFRSTVLLLPCLCWDELTVSDSERIYGSGINLQPWRHFLPRNVLGKMGIKKLDRIVE